MTRVGIVVIGRNEGARLRMALRSARVSGWPVVYADSGSTDGSPELARAEGVEVVAVERSSPLTAARGRNEGLQRLVELHPDVTQVQFLDGDTVLDPSWVGAATAALDQDPGIAAVCGHLQERDVLSSPARRLLQIEWRGPVGEIQACGGNAMYRRGPLDRAGRFRASLAGGEEAELAGRIRAAGGRICRIDAPMGTHDAAIDTLGALWARAVRVGETNAAVCDDLEAHRSDRAMHAQRSAMIWGLLFPTVFVVGTAAAFFEPPLAAVPIAVLLVVAAQTARIFVRARASGLSIGDAALYAPFCIAAKAAHVRGRIRHHMKSGFGRAAAPPNGARGSVS